VWSREGVEVLGRRRARAGDGLHRRQQQWRGAAVARDGVGARGEQGGLICTRVRVTAGDAGRASLCHDGSSVVRTAGATDGPGVRHAHGAVRRRGRRGSRCLGRSERRGAWISGSTCLGRRERREGAWGHGRRGSAGASRRRAERDVAAC
jgi:hypothetical protein